MKLLDVVIKQDEYGDPRHCKALVDPSEVESVCEIDELDAQTEFIMKSGDFYTTPLSIQEAQEWLES